MFYKTTIVVFSFYSIIELVIHMDLKIVGWTNFDSEYPTRKFTPEEFKEVILLIQQEILDNKYDFSGEEHQNALTGVPVFSDGTCFRATMRSWGSIISVLFKRDDGSDCSYMDFYMTNEHSVLPEYKEIDVKPNKDIPRGICSCTIRQDTDLIEEALQFGMPFMTTDKVLKALYEIYKKNIGL